MRRPVIGTGWKMNKTIPQTISYLKRLKKLVADVTDREIFVLPPFTALSEARRVLEGSHIHFGAQDMYWEDWGAYTGEISPPMLVDVGCHYVEIGHSERRQLFGETDEHVNKKVRAALKHGLRPILCIGETAEAKETGEPRAVVGGQLRAALEGVGTAELLNITIAYEPVWAIGVGGTAATPEYANSIHGFIRQLVAERYSGELADQIPILYGGSVSPANAADLIKEPEIDGLFIGRAALDVEAFAQMVRVPIPQKAMISIEGGVL